MGIYGVVPDNYLTAFDSANSYRSHHFENTHRIIPNLQYNLLKDGQRLWVIIGGDLSFNHRNFYYWRNDQSYNMSTHNTFFALRHSYSCRAEYKFGKYGQRNYRNNIYYNYTLSPDPPNLFDMVDVIDDSNPLNIFYGNPNLKMAKRQGHTLSWRYSPERYTFNNTLQLDYSYTDGALTRGYIYDTATGVRHNRMYNIDGINSFSASDFLTWQFGGKKQFSLSSQSVFRRSHYVNLIGVDADAPRQYKLSNRTLSQNLRFGWQIGSQTLSLRCDYTNRHATSGEIDYNSLNVNHLNYGVSANFKLPAGFGINTDFTCYTRRGYGSPELDTTDPIWNMRVSYAPPRNRHWVIMLDGFDMLQKISNVNYAVNADGRVVSYSNALPHYFLLSFQHRLSIKPKR